MHYMLVLFFFLGVFFTYESQAIFILTSRSAKKRLKQTKVYHVFLLCLKGNDPQTFKSSSRKNLFSTVYAIGTTYFHEYLLFFVITER